MYLYRKFVLGTYHWRTFEDFANEATIIGQAFKNLGIKPKDKIAILAETRAEWMITAYACFKNNITIVTIYTNLGGDGIIHAVNETQVPLMVCSEETLPKVANVIGKCDSVKTIVAFESPVDGRLHSTVAVKNAKPSIEIHGYTDLMQMKFTSTPPLTPPKPKDVAIIMYTSGSTGNAFHTTFFFRTHYLNVATFK